MIEPLSVPPPRPKKSRKRLVIEMVAGLFIGAGIGLPFVILLGEREALAFAVALIAWVPSVIVHELGHALAARLVGFRLLQLYIGPCRISHTSSRWRVRTSWLYTFRGACLSAPRSWRGDRAARRELFWFAASGSLANFAFGIPLLFGGFVLKTAGIISILAGLVSWIPARTTDGALLLRILRNDTTALRVRTLGLLAQTLPPAQWPRELVANLAVPIEDREIGSSAAILAYYESLDRGDASYARDMLQRSLDTSSNPRRDAALALEAAIFEGAWRRDARAARAWLERGKPMASEDGHGNLLARAAVAFAEGDATTTATLLKHAAADPPYSSAWLRRTTIEQLGKL